MTRAGPHSGKIVRLKSAGRPGNHTRARESGGTDGTLISTGTGGLRIGGGIELGFRTRRRAGNIAAVAGALTGLLPGTLVAAIAFPNLSGLSRAKGGLVADVLEGLLPGTLVAAIAFPNLSGLSRAKGGLVGFGVCVIVAGTLVAGA